MTLLLAADEPTSALLANIGLLIMRLSIAWLFLWPLPGLIRDWQSTVGATALVYPMPRLVTLLGVCIMPLGAVSVAVGIYGRVGAAALTLYCIGGAFVHLALAKQPAELTRSVHTDQNGQAAVATAAAIGSVGHVTSAWKNWTVAGACAFLALAGTGPWSVLALAPTPLTP